MSTVKVRRVDEGSTNKMEETKAETVQGNTDYLLNYTFDLSLDDHMRRGDEKKFYGTGRTFDDLDETNDQVDNLLTELSELVSHSRNLSIDIGPTRQLI